MIFASSVGSTCVDEASRCAFAELFGFVGQRDLHHPGDVSGWCLHPDGMRRDELRKAGHSEINAGKRHIPNIYSTDPRIDVSSP